MVVLIYFIIKTKGARVVLDWSRTDANFLYGLSKGPGNQNFRPEPYFELNAEILANQQNSSQN